MEVWKRIIFKNTKVMELSKENAKINQEQKKDLLNKEGRQIRTEIDAGEFDVALYQDKIKIFRDEKEFNEWIDKDSVYDSASGKRLKHYYDTDRETGIILAGPIYQSSPRILRDAVGNRFVDSRNRGIELMGYMNPKNLSNDKIIEIAEKYCYKLPQIIDDKNWEEILRVLDKSPWEIRDRHIEKILQRESKTEKSGPDLAWPIIKKLCRFGLPTENENEFDRMDFNLTYDIGESGDGQWIASFNLPEPNNKNIRVKAYGEKPEEAAERLALRIISEVESKQTILGRGIGGYMPVWNHGI